MSKQAVHEIIAGLRAILRFDATAFRHFPGGIGPFLRSFLVVPLLAPLHGAIIWASLASETIADPGRYSLFQWLAFLSSWVIYPLVLLPISRFFKRSNRFMAYISAFNWFQLVEFAVMLPIILLGSLKVIPVEVDFVLWLTAMAVLMAYEWFLLRRGLEVEGSAAAALTVINMLLTLLIYRVAEVLV